MTAFDRFDPFEQRIVDAIGDIAAPRRPDYLDEVFAVTARTSQRPRWTFPGRWIAVLDTTTAARAPRATRALLLVAIMALLALAAATIFIVGSQQRVPSPVGPARNGAIVYASRGDIYRRETLTSEPQLVIGTTSKESGPYLSPDGRTMAFARTSDGGDYLWASDIDGRNPRQLIDGPLDGTWSQWSWALDSRHLLLTAGFGGVRRLYDVAADGSGAREIVLDGLVPWDAFWSPVDPNLFLLRARKTTGVQAMDLYLADADGRNLRPLGLDGQSRFGPDYTLSGEAWSPDGKTIAYNGAELIPDSLDYVFRVHLVNPDGTNDRVLPAPAEPKLNQGWPSFSPDGTQLLVERWRFTSRTGASDGAGWIALLPADGSSVGRDIGLRMDDTTDPDTVKAWSPDGRYVVQFADDGLRTLLIDPATGESTLVELGDDIPDWQRLAP